MTTLSKRRQDYFISLINEIPSEKLDVVTIYKSDSTSGSALVKNRKLADRLEDIKFIESVEQNTRARFLREAHMLSVMKHDNIPNIYDIIESDDIILFRTEHIDGYSLREVLDHYKKNNLSFPRHTASSIVKKLMGALYYTHHNLSYKGKRKSIVHCDIKPENIILSSSCKRKAKLDSSFIKQIEGNRVKPYLIDFGISQFKGKKESGGTLNYLSPQQVKGKTIDWKTDMHQLSLVYVEMLSLVKPYEKKNKKSILLEKKSSSFEIPKSEHITPNIRKFIENGLNPDKHSVGEKHFLKRIHALNMMQQGVHWVRTYKTPILALVIILCLTFVSVFGYQLWDKETQSVDALIEKAQKLEDPSVGELESILEKMQLRAFEKKYYIPLIEGAFRNDAGDPLYPSHLNADGSWILVGTNEDAAGYFVGLLFNYSYLYPELLPYAIEYANPLLEEKYDLMDPKRFYLGLIPAYEATGDEIYLNKLIDVSDELVGTLDGKLGIIQLPDLYYGSGLIWLSEKTGDSKYSVSFERIYSAFIENNIDNDGYVFESATKDLIIPSFGRIPDSKQSKTIISQGTHKIGNFVPYDAGNDYYKDTTSLFTRDFAELLFVTKIMNRSFDTSDLSSVLVSYYRTKNSMRSIDGVFVNSQVTVPLPKDVLGSLKMISFFKEYDSALYEQKLLTLFDGDLFNSELRPGILDSVVLLHENKYDNQNEFFKNQTTIEPDCLFLEI